MVCQQQKRLRGSRRRAQFFINASVDSKINAALNRLLQIHENYICQVLILLKIIRFQVVLRTQPISVVQDLLGLAAQDIRINQGTSPIFVPGVHPEFDEHTLHRHS